MQSYYATAYGSYELYHSGIKGMKWGIRRFQNEDGSLTEAGRERYAKLAGKIEKQQRKIDKWQAKVDKNSKRYLRAEKMKLKATKLRARAGNPWISSQLRTDNLLKAQYYETKAGKMQNNTLKNEAKIRRAQSLINKYSRKIAKINPKSPYATSRFINGQYQKKLSDI